MTVDNNTAACGKAKPYLGIILLLSLAANIFFGGMLVGQRIYGGAGGGKIGAIVSNFKSLSPEGRDAAIAAVEKDWPDIKKSLKDLKAKRAVVKNILLQDKYDQKDLDKAYADVRKAVDALLEKGQGLGGDIAGGLSPDERKKLVTALMDASTF